MGKSKPIAHSPSQKLLEHMNKQVVGTPVSVSLTECQNLLRIERLKNARLMVAIESALQGERDDLLDLYFELRKAG